MRNFTREIRWLLMGIFAGFAIMTLAAAYYATIGSVTLLQREDNPRLVEAQQSIIRGSIYDRNGEILAYTTPDVDGFAQRTYAQPASYSGLGYYSYRYGSAGVEEAFDTQLTGADVPPTLAEHLLGQPAQGSDIQLTLDISVQQAAAEAMGSHQGAVIVMTVPNGEILVLLSQPTYDPNTLDENWEALVEEAGNPFFNRVLQGRYQPGSLIQLPITIGAMMNNQPLSVQFPNGSIPVQLDDLTLTCVIPPPQSSITLRDAFLYGCPSPFTQLTTVVDIPTLRETFNLLHLDDPSVLPDFSDGDNTNSVPPIRLTRQNLTENLLGQGDMTVSPIAASLLTAALINDGNAPQPRMLVATRPPNTETWVPAETYRPTTAYTTASNARRMAELLRASTQTGVAGEISWGDLDVGGQAAVAYSGEGSHVWFVGFIVLESAQNAVVTVVIENTEDPIRALEVGKATLEAVTESIGISNTRPAN